LKALIESGSDEENNQLRCDKNGNLFLSQEVGNSNLENILFRFETFQAGNSYVGLKAAQDLNFEEAIRLRDEIAKIKEI
jgi:excinuclease UvrABC helicase subunit UvrB